VATYKLIQDIEAEDKILGPLTLRQFIFAIVGVFFFYLCFFSVTKGVPFLLIIFLPPALFCAFFALPFGRDQPTEIWALAKLRFWFLPRNRIWNQSGVKELVTITVPKKVEPILTDGLSQTEVKSRLEALANTIDSRGWAIKNVDVYTRPEATEAGADRLIDINNMPTEVTDETSTPNDMLDSNNRISHQVDAMMEQSSQAHHDQLMEKLNAPPAYSPPPINPIPAQFSAPVNSSASVPSGNDWFMKRGATTHTMSAADVPAADETPEEANFAKQLKQKASKSDVEFRNMRTVQPLGSQPVIPPASTFANPIPTVTAPSDPAILALANNDDLNVATIAREVNKAKGEDLSQDEVVISLH
jgi:hypothetical protein